MSRHDTAALATRSDAVVPIVPQEIESDEMRGTGDSNAKEWNKGERERRDRAHSWFATKRRGKARSNGEHEIGEAYGVKVAYVVRLRGSLMSAVANAPTRMSPQPALRTKLCGSLF